MSGHTTGFAHSHSDNLLQFTLPDIFFVLFVIPTDSQPLLIETMQSKRCMRIDEPSHLPSRHSPTCGDTRASVSSSPMGTTSDYYSDSMNHRSSECASGSLVDLTSSASPLLDFGKKERDYISKVIQITCQRTTLLRKNKFTVTSTSGKRSQSASGTLGV